MYLSGIKDMIAIATGIMTIIIALIVAYIAYQQSVTARRKLKLVDISAQTPHP